VTQTFDEVIVRERARITIEESEENEIAESVDEVSARTDQSNNGSRTQEK
jgi:hypothetical protein